MAVGGVSVKKTSHPTTDNYLRLVPIGKEIFEKGLSTLQRTFSKRLSGIREIFFPSTRQRTFLERLATLAGK